jgi:hypothetical protein
MRGTTTWCIFFPKCFCNVSKRTIADAVVALAVIEAGGRGGKRKSGRGKGKGAG